MSGFNLPVLKLEVERTQDIRRMTTNGLLGWPQHDMHIAGPSETQISIVTLPTTKLVQRLQEMHGNKASRVSFWRLGKNGAWLDGVEGNVYLTEIASTIIGAVDIAMALGCKLGTAVLECVFRLDGELALL